MYGKNRKEPNCGKNIVFDGAKKPPRDGDGMPPEDRREEVLSFMAEHGIPFPPKVIFRGLKIERGINFGYSTVKNALSDLAEQGYVTRVDKDALDEGRLETIDEDDSGRRAYYAVTKEGIEHNEEV